MKLSYFFLWFHLILGAVDKTFFSQNQNKIVIYIDFIAISNTKTNIQRIFSHFKLNSKILPVTKYHGSKTYVNFQHKTTIYSVA